MDWAGWDKEISAEKDRAGDPAPTENWAGKKDRYRPHYPFGLIPSYRQVIGISIKIFYRTRNSVGLGSLSRSLFSHLIYSVA